MSSESGTDRRKRMTTAASIFKRLSGASASMRSRGSSMLSKYQKEMMGSDSFRVKDWLLAFVEFLLAFSFDCFGARERSQKIMKMRGTTPRKATNDTLLVLGFASFANILVGQLIDSLTGSYFMALLNSALHFSLASFFLISEIIHNTSSEDVYANLLSNVYAWLFFPIKALGFTRYVYAMDQVSIGKGAPFVIHYTFIFNMFNLLGHFIFFVVKDSSASTSLLTATAFCCNGTVLFLYAYILRPRQRISVAPPPGAAIKIWGVLFTALKNRRKLGARIKRKEWLDYAETHFDKAQIVRSRRIFRLLLMTSPTTGFLMFTTYQGIIFKEFYDGLKLTGTDVPKFMKWILPAGTLLVVIIIEYVVLPLLRACNLKFNFLKRFILGYISLLVAVIVAAVITARSEKLLYRPGRGILRVYNTIEGNVSFESMQPDFTHLHFNVMEKKTFEANFELREQNLFRMAVTFSSPTVGDEVIGNKTSYTQLFSVWPSQVLQYVAIAPSTIVRVPGTIPIKQGPPGQNDPGKPRCLIVSLINDRMQTVYLTNDKTEEFEAFTIGSGEILLFQIEEGNYTITYTTTISQKTTYMLKAGGLYGVYLFLGLNEYEIEVDKIVPERTNHALMGLALLVPMGVAKVFGQVSLDAFVYFTAPDGLKGLAYGFYLFCINLDAWILLFGFYTWHRYITPNIILVYALIAFVSFFFCLALLIRYRNHYSM